ncbi:hypothetical protein SCALIN_C13_0203 [Candidatus Scalindua japonica]|uniref:Uncharacterized protein n=1 Tax=Candidatus Scalindua japonica TaxID=1284222 RepID=A0A286TXT4_9BACT|nr:hypothetical protein SCALIN_C13_0203 [Candidatus Scalindua japonica]
MKSNYSCLKPKSKRKVTRNVPVSTDTNNLNKSRLCLKCGERFLSTGPYNRLCEACVATNEKIAPKTVCVGPTYIDELNH